MGDATIFLSRNNPCLKTIWFSSLEEFVSATFPQYTTLEDEENEHWEALNIGKQNPIMKECLDQLWSCFIADFCDSLDSKSDLPSLFSPIYSTRRAVGNWETWDFDTLNIGEQNSGMKKYLDPSLHYFISDFYYRPCFLSGFHSLFKPILEGWVTLVEHFQYPAPKGGKDQKFRARSDLIRKKSGLSQLSFCTFPGSANVGRLLGSWEHTRPWNSLSPCWFLLLQSLVSHPWRFISFNIQWELGEWKFGCKKKEWKPFLVSIWRQAFTLLFCRITPWTSSWCIGHCDSSWRLFILPLHHFLFLSSMEFHWRQSLTGDWREGKCMDGRVGNHLQPNIGGHFGSSYHLLWLQHCSLDFIMMYQALGPLSWWFILHLLHHWLLLPSWGRKFSFDMLDLRL